jgi:hypothetical protein
MTPLSKITISFLLFLAVAVEAGDNRFGATPKFVRQWQTIQFGLTRGEVHARLGKPTSSIVLSGFPTEYWLFLPSKSRFLPDFNAYAVGYGHNRRVNYLSTPVASSK